MQILGALEQVVLVPRNGLGNRLQAWSSAALLAEDLGVPLRVMWEPEVPAPALPSDLFAEELAESLMPRVELGAILECDHEELPRHLHNDDVRKVAWLAGHDKGEQFFMPELELLLASTHSPRVLVIIAGGLFHLEGCASFGERRSAFLQSVRWHPDVEATVKSGTSEHPTYVGLHIRETDRSREAPTRNTVRMSLRALRERTDTSSLFIAADTHDARQYWSAEASKIGFVPWSVTETQFDRTRRSGALSSVVDWRLLCEASALAYPAASTFSAEAAVAGSMVGTSIPMRASSTVQRARDIRALAMSAITWPVRRFAST